MNPTTYREINAKVMQFSGEIFKLLENQMTKDAMETGDLQSCIEAIVLKAMYYGKTIE